MTTKNEGYPFQGEFRAKVDGVHDGDTVTLLVDCGFRNYKLDKFRLEGINAPELHAADPAVRNAATKSRDRLLALLRCVGQDFDGGPGFGDPWPLRVIIKKGPEKYGRWLARVFVRAPSAKGADCVEICVNDQLVAEGLAVPFMVDALEATQVSSPGLVSPSVFQSPCTCSMLVNGVHGMGCPAYGVTAPAGPNAVLRGDSGRLSHEKPDYFDELSDIIEQHPPGMPGTRR